MSDDTIITYVCVEADCSYSVERSWRDYDPICPCCRGKVVAESSLHERQGVVRAVAERRADYEAHIEKTYREVWRWLERELGQGFNVKRQRELISIFNNPYNKS